MIEALSGALIVTADHGNADCMYEIDKKSDEPKVDAQGEKLDIHALRTTCASRMARNNVPLVKAQRILGHSDPKLTAVHYVGLDVEDLRDAVEGLPAPRTQPKKTREAR